MKETTLTLEQIETIITGYPDAPYFICYFIIGKEKEHTERTLFD